MTDTILPTLPNNLYRAEQARELDQLLIEEHKIPGIVLMKRAGRALFEKLCEEFPHGSITILCGAGNNAGDGYVVGALASQAKRDVQILYVTPPTQLKDDARRAYEYAEQESVKILPFTTGAVQHLPDGCVIVDALVGTGLTGELRANLQEVIREVNSTGLPVIAVDVPSGICANTGRTLGEAIQAYITLTFIGCKQGLLTGRAPAFVGKLFFEDLGAPRHLFSAFEPSSWRIHFSDFTDDLPPRSPDAHKGEFGHVLVVGGDHGMGGAAIMAAESALYSGAGKVSLATQPAHVAAAQVRQPEIMALGVTAGGELLPWLNQPTVIVAGMGLGKNSWSEQLLQQVLKTECPLVLDADALSLVANQLHNYHSRGHWVLTPHPGEAATLLNTSTAVVQQNRFDAVEEIQRTYGGVVVLKGAGTLICDGYRTYVANVGNPGLATAGSGDVLAGLIAGLIAQGLDLSTAAQLGVCAHGEAGDLLAAEQGQRGLCASDLPRYIRELLNN